MARGALLCSQPACVRSTYAQLEASTSAPVAHSAERSRALASTRNAHPRVAFAIHNARKSGAATIIAAVPSGFVRNPSPTWPRRISPAARTVPQVGQGSPVTARNGQTTGPPSCPGVAAAAMPRSTSATAAAMADLGAT